MSDKKNARPVIGVGVLIWREQQLLLGERLTEGKSNCWQFPGGHLENNESVIACAVREVQEETGVQVKNLRHLGFTDKQFEIAGRNYITLLVSCEYDAGEVVNREPEKCAGWKWFDYQNLPETLFVPISLFISQGVTPSGDGLYALHCASKVLSGEPSGGHK